MPYVSIPGLLGILFVGLKLTHVIAWSWWWVLAPFWVPSVAALAVAAIALTIYLGVRLLG